MNLAVRIILIVALIAGGFWAWTTYREHKASYDGAITWVQGKPSPAEKAAFDRKNSGDDDTASAARSAGSADGSIPASPSTATATAPSAVASSAAQPAGYPAQAVPGTTEMPVSTSQANAPDGYKFGGNGKYEFYRQGDLTFRLDTETGRTCIVFATLEEWRKPLVMNRGCANAS